jgi:hypothetical protein
VWVCPSEDLRKGAVGALTIHLELFEPFSKCGANVQEIAAQIESKTNSEHPDGTEEGVNMQELRNDNVGLDTP